MSSAPTGERYCPHGMPVENCAYCCSRMPYFLQTPQQHPSVAGHCGKCGAPYGIDYNHMGTDTKFAPSCKCWNT